MTTDKRPLKVFLCHAHADRDAVRTLWTNLTNDGVDAWLDKKNLLPGQKWRYEIRRAVKEADVVIVCHSKEFNQMGFRQREVRWALDAAMEKPDGEIFIIPARLEECDVLETLSDWHWVDLYGEDGYEKLLSALRTRADAIGATLQLQKNKLLTNTLSQDNERKSDGLIFGVLIVLSVIIGTGIVLSTKIQIVLNILNDLLNWQYFWTTVILWVVIDILLIEKWKALLGRIAKLIMKPWIFATDEKPNDLRWYPRSFLEQLTINSHRNRVVDRDGSLKSIGYLVTLILFFFFILADAVIVTNIQWLMGAISSVPESFQRLDIAFLSGVVFTVLTSVWTLVEYYGTGGVIVSNSMTIPQKTLYQWIAVIAIFISIVLMISLAIDRLINVGFLVATDAMEMTLSFVSYGLLAVNTFLSATLVFFPAILGLQTLTYVLHFLTPVFVIVADIIWRLIYVIIDIAFWVIFTPILAIFFVIGKMFGVISNNARS